MPSSEPYWLWAADWSPAAYSIAPSADSVFKEGDEGNMAYVVQDGEVEVVKIIDGHEKVLRTVGKGGTLGEMALIDRRPPHGGGAGCERHNTYLRYPTDVRRETTKVRSIYSGTVKHSR